MNMKKYLIAFFLGCAVSLFGDDLLHNAPWRFVSAEGGAGNVEKIAGNGRKISAAADKGFVSFANSRALPITPGRNYRISAKVVCGADTNAAMLNSAPRFPLILLVIIVTM